MCVCRYIDTNNNNKRLTTISFLWLVKIEPEDEGIVLLGFDEVGRLDGAKLGWSVGCDDGCADGFDNGCRDGCDDGCNDGCADGFDNGCRDGCDDGCNDGCTDDCSEC